MAFLAEQLPGIGALFGSKTYNHARSELIIFMTPHVIYDETSLIEASDELKSQREDAKQVHPGLFKASTFGCIRLLFSPQIALHSTLKFTPFAGTA